MKFSPHDRIVCEVVDRWLAYRFQHSSLPGGQLCIRKEGDVLISAAYGHANTQTKTNMTPNHICRIASNSKMFASCALQMLEAEKKLSLDDLAVRYIPQLGEHADRRFREITVRDLLTEI